MKRVTEKVKDIVEVCSFTHLHDFAADPNLTLAGYHFTDITADLMGKWIGRVADVKPGHGTALALAGFRGVGKSHFLSVLTALLSRPELRSQISDSHVASAAERLPRRHVSVASVRRGSGTSLVDELKRAIAEVTGTNAGTLSDSLDDLLIRGAEHAGELPFVLLIDTAHSRVSRVSRDDGALLSEIAEAAKTIGIFVGVALDDDISGADGPNSSITSSFTIDYLDQEHLYKIVDTHIFSKRQQMLPLLNEIYAYYREVMPGFRWSQQRFISLYPLHPATVEIAPLIRLYIQDFALLGFAADTGVRIMGRPANSLIGLDEIYDSVEQKLRSVPELDEIFTAFDRAEHDVIAKMPVAVRLPAKLLLKGLLMLSLSGQGSTATEIAASMMIFNNGSTIDVPHLLDSFAAALPNSIARVEREGSDPRYLFQPNQSTATTDLITQAVAHVPPEAIWHTLFNQAVEKFSDLEPGTGATTCSVEWRGSIRRGEILWSQDAGRSDEPDWLLEVGHQPTSGSDIFWQVAKPSAEEELTLRRYYVLQTDAGVRGAYGDGIATAIHVESIAVEKVWQRVFLHDARLLADSVEYELSELAWASHSLAQLFTLILVPVFESRYPDHPVFSEILGLKQVSTLTENLFGGSDQTGAETQRLAAAFAVPLELAAIHNDKYLPATGEALLESGLVKSMIPSTSSTSEIIPLQDLSARMKARPHGLTRESQHLMLAALVSQRLCEFVTASGNRISHRSLDLQIIWDDIVGIAAASDQLYSPKRLLTWARLITGDATITSLDTSESRRLVIDSLTRWLVDWKQSRVLADFDELPDENLSAEIWRTATSQRKSFGAMAETVESVIANEITLDHAIHTIGEKFADSESEFERKKDDLNVLRDFVGHAARRNEILNYLVAAELTKDGLVEKARQALIDDLDRPSFVDRWTEFHSLFSAYYRERHNEVMDPKRAGDSLKSLLVSTEWALFEDYSRASLIDTRVAGTMRSMISELRQMHCSANLEEVIADKPYCSCSFSLRDYETFRNLPQRIGQLVSESVERAARKLPNDLSNNTPRRLSGVEIRSLMRDGESLVEMDEASDDTSFFHSVLEPEQAFSGSDFKT